MTEQPATLGRKTLLDLGAPVEVHDEPYRWAVVRDLVPPPVRARIRDEVPVLRDEARAVRHQGGDKNYGMFVMPLVARERPLPALADQPEVMRRLVSELTGSDYRAWVGEILGVDVTGCAFDVGVFHFRHADYVTSHTDREGKAATHVLYFNEAEWLSAYGGMFEVRDSGDPAADPVAVVEPSQGRSVLFGRRSNSWHAVSPIAAPDGVVRWTMQVEMWGPGR